ncbi:hypothetical protein NHX12_016989 [Muraenolepis orangiensis]|uniref:Uncharacterized protein n=1 Tax=Muraenolepis orangiensis TaxID=630683 RepID=A0A9Q0I343_9TELE|nr:hypothetical protein NHX12_017025 [Muraenolepis orangiensis]KAJ3583540.1 hypothetical protein NHX12_016989 [Muraenolepis orangiensis]
MRSDMALLKNIGTEVAQIRESIRQPNQAQPQYFTSPIPQECIPPSSVPVSTAQPLANPRTRAERRDGSIPKRVRTTAQPLANPRTRAERRDRSIPKRVRTTAQPLANPRTRAERRDCSIPKRVRTTAQPLANPRTRAERRDCSIPKRVRTTAQLLRAKSYTPKKSLWLQSKWK